MTRLRQLASSLLLAAGLVMVFGGISAALGFSIPGMLASVAAIAALLYAGGIWFHTPPSLVPPAGADTIIVFDRALLVAAGASIGAPLLAQFPPSMHPELSKRCRAALRGEHAHFLCEHDGRRLSFNAAPVPMSDGAVLYGVLICGGGIPATLVRPASPLTTVAN
jgi:hypothetical protein